VPGLPMRRGPQIEDMRARAARHGRDPSSIVFFQGLGFIVGEPRPRYAARRREIDDVVSDEG